MAEEMTVADWEELRRSMNSFGFQDQNGVDLTLIEGMLALTPTERIEELQHWMEVDEELRRARVRFYGSDPADAVETERGEG